MTIELAGERVELLAGRALWRPAASTLLIADPHWGKAATLRHANLPIPPGSTTDDLRRLSELLVSTRAERLVILGDLLHAKQGRHPETIAAVEAWRRNHAELTVALVRGNHDLRAGDPPATWRMECHDEPLRDGPFALRHVPGPEPGAYVLAGHLHPKARLWGPAGEVLKLHCFRIGPASAVLPAFSGLADGGLFQPRPDERVFVIAEDEVVEVPGVRRDRAGGG
ncbi:MAG: ligase-associated DNA damage response endonuclease PdeM [Acidobacteria bacterium]|nr:ligase-associated DNA damage response endonuclease PdeM [Acidobacteriota bacterium]